MADDSVHGLIDEDDEYANADSPGDVRSPVATKRARGQGGLPRSLSAPMPQDVCDAMIKLRVSKEKEFIKSSDGRTRNSGTLMWNAISEELATEFLHREDVLTTSIHPRSLGKKWSYVEKNFKVSVLSVCVVFRRDLTSPCLAILGISQAKWC